MSRVLSVRLEEDEHRLLQLASKLQGKTVSELVREALTRHAPRILQDVATVLEEADRRRREDATELIEVAGRLFD